MRTKEEIRQIVLEVLKHTSMRDMPDYGGSNSDHDNRYLRKYEDIELPADKIIYIGSRSVDNSWRITIDSSNRLSFERRDAGVWTYYGRFGLP